MMKSQYEAKFAHKKNFNSKSTTARKPFISLVKESLVILKMGHLS